MIRIGNKKFDSSVLSAAIEMTLEGKGLLPFLASKKKIEHLDTRFEIDFEIDEPRRKNLVSVDNRDGVFIFCYKLPVICSTSDGQKVAFFINWFKNSYLAFFKEIGRIVTGSKIIDLDAKMVDWSISEGILTMNIPIKKVC